MTNISPSVLPVNTLIISEDRVWIKTSEEYWVEVHYHCVDCIDSVSNKDEVFEGSIALPIADEFFKDFKILAIPPRFKIPIDPEEIDLNYNWVATRPLT